MVGGGYCNPPIGLAWGLYHERVHERNKDTEGFFMVRKTRELNRCCAVVRHVLGASIVAACVLASGCTTGRTGVNPAMAWGPAAQARHAAGQDGVVAGVHADGGNESSDASGWEGEEGVPVALGSRRDQALGMRSAATLFEVDSWSPAPMPSLDRLRRIYVSPNPSTHTYFRHGDRTLYPRYEGWLGNYVR